MALASATDLRKVIGPAMRRHRLRGAAPDTQLTPQALADMSEEKFAALFNELQTRGDKTKLMQLFGH